MIYSEAAYFTTNACHHCAARDEHERLARITRTHQRLAPRRRHSERFDR